MAVASSSISWLQAFQLLPLLALNTMLQPVGRVLGSSAFHSVWFRASPIICALDTLALIVRLIAYRTWLHATLREALLMVGMDRFDEAKTDQVGRKTTVIATTVRFVGFFLSILEPIYMVGAWGKFRWTVAWAWMYFASYIVLEIASQLSRRELSKPQYTAADFELEALGESYDDETSHAESTEATVGEASDQTKPMTGKPQDESKETVGLKFTPGTTSSEMGSINDEIDNYSVDHIGFMASASTEHLLGTASDEGQYLNDDGGSTLAQVETTASVKRTGPSDLEAAKDNNSKYQDPLTSPRLPPLKLFFEHLDVLLLRWGCLLHGIFIYWAYLDFIHAPLHTYILSSTGWGIPLYFLKLPFIFAAMFLTLFATLSIPYGIVQGIVAISKFVQESLPIFLQERLKTGVMIVSMGAVVFAFYAGCFGVSYWVGNLLLGEFMQWVYSVLTVEAVLLLIFSSIYFGLYLLLKRAAEITSDVSDRFEVAGYLGETGVVLLTCLIITFTVSILWYRFRYPYSAQWVHDWRETLVSNATMA